AVAVATNTVPAALGTDTGGSARIPAAFCGIAGLRPTHGTIPMDGIQPLAPSMDTPAVLARTARECARLHQQLDSTTTDSPTGIADRRIGWPSMLWTDKADPEVRELLDA